MRDTPWCCADLLGGVTVAAAAAGMVTGAAAAVGVTVAAVAAGVAAVTLGPNADCSTASCTTADECTAHLLTVLRSPHTAAVVMQGPRSCSPRTGRAASRHSWTRRG